MAFALLFAMAAMPQDPHERFDLSDVNAPAPKPVRRDTIELDAVVAVRADTVAGDALVVRADIIDGELDAVVAVRAATIDGELDALLAELQTEYRRAS